MMIILIGAFYIAGAFELHSCKQNIAATFLAVVGIFFILFGVTR
jgi:hypothetical protein